MTKFLLGCIAGAAAVALLQLTIAPLPQAGSITPGPEGGQDANATDLVAQSVAEAPPAESRGSVGRVPTSPSSRIEQEPDSDADQPEGPSGPRNPIELPSTHSGFVDKSRPSLPDEHAALEAEDADPGWAQLVEELIYSHVSSHPNGESIGIVSLVCRTSRCEIVGTVYGERGGDIWQEVVADMRKQAWFANNFADSMLGAGGGMPGEHRFVTLLARVGSEISPPVDP